MIGSISPPHRWPKGRFKIQDKPRHQLYMGWKFPISRVISPVTYVCFGHFGRGLEKRNIYIKLAGGPSCKTKPKHSVNLAPQNNCQQLWELESILRFFVLPASISYLCIHFRICNFGCVQMPVDHMKVKIRGRMEPPIFENRDSLAIWWLKPGRNHWGMRCSPLMDSLDRP